MRQFADESCADLRYTLRSARRNKGFFIAVVVTLALAIGVSTAMLSATYGVLMRPLPFPDSSRIVQLWEEHPGVPPDPGYPPLPNTTFYGWRHNLRSLERLGLFGPRDFTLTLASESLRVHGGEVSPSIFDVLRVTPQLGRFFVASDDVAGHHDFVVLSDRLWRSHFNASTDIIGQSVLVDGRPHAVVGVARPGLAFPDDEALLWTPFDDPTLIDPKTQGGVWLGEALGRMRPGATLDEVRAEGTAAARSMARPPILEVLLGKGGPVEMRVKTLVAQKTDSVRPALLVLVAGVVVVLLVGCANVANLLLARGVARDRELLLRAAIGASRGRVVRQLLTETLVYVFIGGGLGFLLAAGLLNAAASLAGASVPRLREVTVDITTAGIAAALAIAVALLAGLAPAMRNADTDVAGGLRGADGAIGEGFRGRRANVFRRVLLAAETALAVLLLVGATLVGRSFGNLINVDPGYSPQGVLTVRAFAPDQAPPERVGRFMSEMTSRLRGIGGVVSAGAGNMMPFNPSTTVAAFDIPAALGNGRDVRTRVAYYVVTPGYAEALGLRLLAGRFLRDADAAAAIQPVVVNDEFVRAYLSPARSVGLQLPPRRAGLPPMEIVGVVAAQRRAGNDQPVMPEMYAAATAVSRIGPEIDVVVKTDRDPIAVAAVIRDLTREIDSTFVIGEIAPLDRLLSNSVRQPRLAAAVLMTFAGVALIFAAVGVYGVISYSVSQRTHELAVRSALGAERRRLLGMVMGEGLVIAAVGAAAGLAAAAALTRLMSAVLFGVDALDPLSFLSAPLTLLPVVALACLIPAARAARTNPSIVLRH